MQALEIGPEVSPPISFDSLSNSQKRLLKKVLLLSPAMVDGFLSTLP